jgi:hypothetical protein
MRENDERERESDGIAGPSGGTRETGPVATTAMRANQKTVGSLIRLLDIAWQWQWLVAVAVAVRSGSDSAQSQWQWRWPQTRRRLSEPASSEMANAEDRHPGKVHMRMK